MRLKDYLDDPRLAWPEPATSNLPGPILYWTSTVAVVAAVIGAGALWLRFRTRRHEPVDRRRRVGVDAQPRLATTRTLHRSSPAKPNPVAWSSGNGSDGS